MKRLLLLISFSILCLFSFTQTNVQQDPRVDRILKGAFASQSGYYIYGRTRTSRFINIAVLNQSSRTLCWFTCHGRLFDSTKLTTQEFEQVTSKQLDPFVLHQNLCDSYLANIAAAKDIYRMYGDIQLLDKLNGNYRALFAMETVQDAKTPLQKLMAIENVRKKILTQLAYLNCVSPFNLEDDSLYKISKEQAGAMIQSKDSTVYYNIDPASAVVKISLYKKSAGQLYIQNRFSEIIDSVAIQPEKFDLLQKEKTDVFLLYRGWLEMQWQGALAAIRRESVELYNQVNAHNEKEVKELYSQLNAIGAKINQLNSPEAKSIEQTVYDTYKSETSEIAYMPLVGIAYTLTQSRGVKEYELTNHLGNVLITLSDKKNQVPSISDGSVIDHYEPDIVSAQDYYPFGMLQPGRSYLSSTGDKYRYGFNGKENDNEVKGQGNQQDYGMRIYDPRLARFLSVDPIAKSYPMLTPYQFASNSPILGVDLDGLEFYNSNSSRIGIGLNFDPKLKKITSFSTYYRSENLPDALNAAINSANTCSNCIGSSAANVATFHLNILNPFVKYQDAAEAKDMEIAENTTQTFSSVGPSAAASQTWIVPYDKKSEREQRKTRAYFTEGGSPAIAKFGAVMAAVDLASTLLQYIGNENLKSIVRTAQSQSLNGAVKAIGIIQNAIDAGRLDKYLDAGSLVGLANYLLYGNTIEKYEVKNGKGTYVEDKELTKIARDLFSVYMGSIREKNQQEESKRERKRVVDNVGGH